MKQRYRTPRFSTQRLVGSLTILALLIAAEAPAKPEKTARCDEPWSEPTLLGDGVNSPSSNEMNATLSPDGLSIYFVSNRPDVPGGTDTDTDIWVSQRACADCDWEPAQRLDAVNSPLAEGGPSLSEDGLLLFFHSDRSGNNDIYVSRRTDPTDDFGWGLPVALGPAVNTSDGEFSPEFVKKSEEPGNAAVLYFGRGSGAVPGNNQDIWKVPITQDGVVIGPAEPIDVLNSAVNDAAPTVRGDGKELMFWSPRPGGEGSGDIWVSTRHNIHDPWSSPVNLGPPINTSALERRPNLTHSGRTLLFDRVDANLNVDIWESRRLTQCR